MVQCAIHGHGSHCDASCPGYLYVTGPGEVRDPEVGPETLAEMEEAAPDAVPSWVASHNAEQARAARERRDNGDKK